MTRFAEETGLTTPPRTPVVISGPTRLPIATILDLYRRTSKKPYQNDAKHLVLHVHRILGRHREDDARRGWISCLEEEGEQHPTRGGLRMGNKHREHRPDEPYDDHLEWERDRQYFHYLTKWMHALNCRARVTGDSMYHRWAVELAKTAHARFTYTPWSDGHKHMHWKMSIDLSYPLVTSMGEHDPLDGLIAYQQLQATTENLANRPQTVFLKQKFLN